MAGYVIHIAVGKEYLRKHKEESDDEEDFMQGVIAPDKLSDKTQTHYGKGRQKVDLQLFLEKNTLDMSYQRGYLLHLLTDYLFYHVYFHNLPPVYDDYDRLNKRIIEKYELAIPEPLKKYAKITEGEPNILKEDIIDQMIKEISEKSIQKHIEEIERSKE